MNSSRSNEHSLRITADEVNCLIYAYLLDSGFVHAAFAIKAECQLDSSPYASKHIQRGELVELLSKSLLYIEVESHWKNDALANNCKSSFSLLEPHICSNTELSNQPHPIEQRPANAPTDAPARPPKPNGSEVDGGDPKRKDSPTSAPTDGPAEKRTKRDPEDMDLDTPYEPLDGTSTNSVLPDPAVKKVPKKPRMQGPDDESTDPNAILLLPGHKSEVFVCGFNPAFPELLATGSKDAVVSLWTIPKNVENPIIPTTVTYFSRPDQADLTSLNWNADGTLVAIGSYDSILRICTSKGELYFSHSQHRGPIFAAKFSRSGKWLLTASLDGTSCLWDVQQKLLYKQFRCHKDVEWVDENTFATCGADRVIHIIRVHDSEPIKTLTGHGNEINQIKCSPSSTHLASCCDDMTARVWNIEKLGVNDSIPGFVTSDPASHPATVLHGHRHSVSAIAWCPDPTIGPHPLLATSSFDCTARLWDSVTGKCLKVLTDHKRPVYTLTFSPDGRWLATGSGDGMLHIYSVVSHEKKWSWYAGPDRPGVYEIDWQIVNGFNRIALALDTTLRALLTKPTKLSAAHAHVRLLSNLRPMPTGRPLQSLRPKSDVFSGLLFANRSRSFMTEGTQVAQQAQGISWQRMAMTAAGVAGAVVVIDGIFNRETRESLSPGEKSLLHETFQYTGGGLALTALAARQMAALYTCGVVGSISYVGATATTDKYLNLGGPLLAGVTVVALSSLAPMALPLGLRGLAVTEAISLYGGLAVFGGFVLYDTQKILKHGRLVEQGSIKADPITEAISLQLDMINIFIRLVQILAMNQRKK
ncbi:hypothetical protein H0H93_005727 [Arthromyces matolae]|nr:hypothetical protein H0H93_005727 [Arthromyces matolae]